MVPEIVLTLLGRGYCHLCDEMAEALVPIAVAHGARIEIVDVDARPELEERWGDLVPVLLFGAPEDGAELCHYHLDANRVTAALNAAAGNGTIC